MEENNIDEALKADESQIDDESPASEELPVEETVEEVNEPSADEDVTEGATEDDNRKTAKARIQELVAEKKEAVKTAETERVRAESLADQVKKMTSGYTPQPFLPPQDTASEISVDELMQRQDALVQIRMKQQEHLNRVNNEAQDVVRAHPELDPDSASYKPKLAERLAKATMSFIQSNPTESLKDYVDGFMEDIHEAVEKQSVSQKETITKQVSEQAMRPTQVPDQEKPFEELSIKEMEKKLGVAYR